jgi:hypothetical protein
MKSVLHRTKTTTTAHTELDSANTTKYRPAPSNTVSTVFAAQAYLQDKTLRGLEHTKNAHKHAQHFFQTSIRTEVTRPACDQPCRRPGC